MSGSDNDAMLRARTGPVHEAMEVRRCPALSSDGDPCIKLAGHDSHHTSKDGMTRWWEGVENPPFQCDPDTVEQPGQPPSVMIPSAQWNAYAKATRRVHNAERETKEAQAEWRAALEALNAKILGVT